MSTDCRRRAILALPDLQLVPVAVGAQEIVYGQFPATSSDSQGTALFSTESSGPRTYDLTINGQTAFTFYSGYSFSIIPATGNAVQSVAIDLLGDNSAVPLAYGQPIGPDAHGNIWAANPPYGPVVVYGQFIGGGSLLTAGRASGTIGDPILTSGYFTGLASGYIGLQFQQDGKTHYGWARVGAPFVGLNGGYLYDYAYETLPDTPILVGAVPEPSTYALLGVGLAGGILYRFRRRP